MQKEKFHSQGLSYYCNQSIDDFEQNGENLHCQLCSKNIIDFRTKTKAEYNKIVATNKDVCGIFYANQIGDEIEINLNWKKPFIYFGFLSSLLASKPLLAQHSTNIKTEIVDSSSFSETRSTTDSVQTCQKTEENHLENSSEKKELPYYHKRKRRLYLSRRFPFVHYDKKYRHLIGAPRYW